MLTDKTIGKQEKAEKNQKIQKCKVQEQSLFRMRNKNRTDAKKKAANLLWGLTAFLSSRHTKDGCSTTGLVFCNSMTNGFYFAFVAGFFIQLSQHLFPFFIAHLKHSNAGNSQNNGSNWV